MSWDDFLQALERGQQLILLPKQCQLTYDEESKPELLGLIEQVPHELWGARLALQVSHFLHLLSVMIGVHHQHSFQQLRGIAAAPAIQPCCNLRPDRLQPKAATSIHAMFLSTLCMFVMPSSLSQRGICNSLRSCQHVSTCVQVLAHRIQGSESFFSSYIQNLPVGVSGIPMFFAREPLKAIAYAPVTQQVSMRCQWLLHFAREALQPLPGTPADPFSGTLIDANVFGMSCLE